MEAIARTLLVVTLALDDAVARQDTRETDGLIRRRQELLDQLGGAPLTPNVAAILTTTADVEKRVLANLEGARSAIARRLRDRQQRRRAGKAYTAAATSSRWEQRS
jgi:hypothetical protein